MQTSNGNSITFENPPPEPDGDSPLIEAFRDALGEILAQQEQQWTRERALIEAEAARAIAEFRAEMSEQRIRNDAVFALKLEEMGRTMAERLALVRDGARASPVATAKTAKHPRRSWASRSAGAKR